MNRLRMCILTLALLLPSLLPTLKPLLHPRLIRRSMQSQLRRLAYCIETRIHPATLVLLYHRVLPLESNDGFQLSVTCDRFRDQLRWLSRHTQVVSLDRLSDPPGPSQRRVVITFDDGYRDNWVHAAPLLSERMLPATFYLTSGYLGTERRFWWDEAYARCKADACGSDPGALVSRVQRICSELRPLPPLEREARLRDLGAEPPPAQPIDLPMSWLEAQELHRRGFTVGAHTVNHPALSGLSASEAKSEVVVSRRMLEQGLTAPVRHFCYPYDEAVRWSRRIPSEQTNLVRAAGFDTAVTVVEGALTRQTNRLSIPRLAVGNWPLERFVREVEYYLRPSPQTVVERAKAPSGSDAMAVAETASTLREG